MNTNTLAQNLSQMQVPMDRVNKMDTDDLKDYVIYIISVYGKYSEKGFRLYAKDMPLEEKLIFISKICDPAEYSFHMSSERRKQAAAIFYESKMQTLIEDNFIHYWFWVDEEIEDDKYLRNSCNPTPFQEEVQTFPDGTTMTLREHKLCFGDY